GVAAVCASAVRAGIIASSSGSAMVAPTPRRTVRRDRCFFVMNILLSSFPTQGSGVIRKSLSVDALVVLCARCQTRFSGQRRESKRLARDDAGQNRRERIVVACRIAHDPADRGHVVILDAA